MLGANGIIVLYYISLPVHKYQTIISNCITSLLFNGTDTHFTGVSPFASPYLGETESGLLFDLGLFVCLLPKEDCNG